MRDPAQRPVAPLLQLCPRLYVVAMRNESLYEDTTGDLLNARGQGVVVKMQSSRIRDDYI